MAYLSLVLSSSTTWWRSRHMPKRAFSCNCPGPFRSAYPKVLAWTTVPKLYPGTVLGCIWQTVFGRYYEWTAVLALYELCEGCLEWMESLYCFTPLNKRCLTILWHFRTAYHCYRTFLFYNYCLLEIRKHKIETLFLPKFCEAYLSMLYLSISCSFASMGSPFGIKLSPKRPTIDPGAIPSSSANLKGGRCSSNR